MPWFRFDSSALQDEKLVMLHRKHGHAGIGLYMRLICLCYESNGELPAYKLPIIFEAYDEPQGQAMFSTMVELRLFIVKKDENGEEIVTSRRVLKELAKEEEYRKMRSDIGKKAGQASAEKRRQANNSTSVQRPSTSSQHTSTKANHHTVPNRTLPNQDNQPGKNDGRTNERPSAAEQREDIKQWNDDDVKNLEEQFLPYAVAASDETYAQKTWDQRLNLRAENRAEFYRKCVLFVTYSRIRSDKMQGKARVLFHEIAGFINDRGAMEKAIDGKEVAKRREFAKQETGNADDAGEVGAVGNVPVPEWE